MLLQPFNVLEQNFARDDRMLLVMLLNTHITDEALALTIRLDAYLRNRFVFVVGKIASERLVGILHDKMLLFEVLFFIRI